MSFARDSELNGVVWLMFAFCINKFMKNVRTHVCGTAKGRCCFPMKRKWKSAKPLEHGSAYLTQLQYIINLLCEKRTKDNVADSRQRRKKTSVIWYYVTRLIGSNSKSPVWNKNWEKHPIFTKVFHLREGRSKTFLPTLRCIVQEQGIGVLHISRFIFMFFNTGINLKIIT